jgi:hypothetical protein
MIVNFMWVYTSIFLKGLKFIIQVSKNMKIKNKVYLNLRKSLLILILLLINVLCYGQNFEVKKVLFIWTDNNLRTVKNEKLYIISNNKHKTDTIFPRIWNQEMSDTVIFEPGKFSNPVHIELESNSVVRKSNKFNLLPDLDYVIIERTDTLLVKARPHVFDSMDEHIKLLYSFLIKLVIELLLTIPVAILLRLPPRLIFFVFVANIMSFPLQYAYFLSPEVKELIGIVLEGVFIYAIGWKRLKIYKALLVSLLLNVLRFGIAKIVMMVVKYL